ncbi:MAG: type II toxin-antitoxin system mRNA interferase toxin, RelE/StbE family [Sulfurimonas sp.]|uniref:type II toxin-antitoxin system RelE family toxin n=1 Tax=Sulfurimonas sp. TaxID=2022749 RepID=UPI00261CDFE8|nr:type II toxin-antitoxin system mRNA interferase toxin, RelE/StbE family [Sulfurimonas sp.]MDD2652129.1 type II toxin-antitoxin system mRNA interferase toxin, RelE/StbE family [Sulfurimonas sp.]MDD3451961.1 type II toxin-antitoxin system mRNA interferase toxin, RelE/StbE family [Sulfurimonas sp.]
MSDFLIAEANSFIKIKNEIDKKQYDKIVNVVYPQLKRNPFFGTNIKKLKGEFEEYYRYRIGNYRLFYLVENEKVVVVVVDFKHRQNAYD